MTRWVLSVERGQTEPEAYLDFKDSQRQDHVQLERRRSSSSVETGTHWGRTDEVVAGWRGMAETIICVGGAAFVGIQLTSNWIVARMGKSEDRSRCSLGGLG